MNPDKIEDTLKLLITDLETTINVLTNPQDEPTENRHRLIKSLTRRKTQLQKELDAFKLARRTAQARNLKNHPGRQPPGNA